LLHIIIRYDSIFATTSDDDSRMDVNLLFYGPVRPLHLSLLRLGFISILKIARGVTIKTVQANQGRTIAVIYQYRAKHGQS